MECTDQVVTVSGEDRHGVLDDVCGVIERNHGLIVNIRSIDICGSFAMIVQVRIGERAREGLANQLDELGRTGGLNIQMRNSDRFTTESSHLFRLVAHGTEHVGTLKKLSHLLRVLHINIEHVDTNTEPDGNVRMSLVLAVPRECPVTKLREFVGQLLSTMQLKWELTGL